MRPPLFAAVTCAAALLTGCASVACTPGTIVVDRKEERSRLRSESRGTRTDATGRVTEQRRDVVVAEYWIRERDGRWFQASEAEWRAAEPGRPLSLCR